MSGQLDLLRASPSAAEMDLLQEQIDKLEKLRLKTSHLSPEQWEEGLARVAPLRLRCSTTLKQGNLSSWCQANYFVAQRIQAAEAPAWNHILQINAILCQQHEGKIRTENIYLGRAEACAPDLLEEHLLCFQREILSPENPLHPLVKAALCQYWLVSLHPFNDANGRTSVLLADWILNAAGYLPMTFESQVDAIIGIFSTQRKSATPFNAMQKLIANVLRSYELI